MTDIIASQMWRDLLAVAEISEFQTREKATSGFVSPWQHNNKQKLFI